METTLNRTLESIRSRQKTRTLRQKIETLNLPYQPWEGIEIITYLIKEQNLILLNKIAKWKNLDPEHTEDFISMFHKPSYHVPDIVSKSHEDLLKYLIKLK